MVSSALGRPLLLTDLCLQHRAGAAQPPLEVSTPPPSPRPCLGGVASGAAAGHLKKKGGLGARKLHCHDWGNPCLGDNTASSEVLIQFRHAGFPIKRTAGVFKALGLAMRCHAHPHRLPSQWERGSSAFRYRERCTLVWEAVLRHVSCCLLHAAMPATKQPTDPSLMLWSVTQPSTACWLQRAAEPESQGRVFRPGEDEPVLLLSQGSPFS